VTDRPQTRWALTVPFTGVPLAALANQGPATVSTKVSETSLRHTNDDHSGNSPARIRPTRSHFAATAAPAATPPAASSTSPPHSAALQMPKIRASACSMPSTASPIAAVTITGSTRNASTTDRIAFNRHGGS